MTTTSYPGYFISFEGIDGAGKSTHIDAFAKLIQERYPHREVVLTREPGGTALGAVSYTHLTLPTKRIV